MIKENERIKLTKMDSEFENNLQKLSNDLRELKNHEIDRLTKLFCYKEIHKKTLKNDTYEILCMLFGIFFLHHIKIGEEIGKREYFKMTKKKAEILKNFEKYKTFAFVKPPKKIRNLNKFGKTFSENNILNSPISK